MQKQLEMISKTEKPLTKKDIITGLKRLGLKKDSFIEVHTSLSSFGYIVNKSYDICDALTELITEGVIIMPAHTTEQTDPSEWSNPPIPKEWIPIILDNRKPFDRKLFLPERVGITPTVFLNYPGVQRTNHPQVSLLVFNKTEDNTWINHSFDDRDFISPLFKLTQENGKILFLGTDFFTCTSIHLSEQFSPYAIEKRFVNKILDVAGNPVEQEIITYDFDDEIVDNFEVISKRYIEKYKGTEDYKQTKIGLATVTLIDAKKLYDIAEDFHRNYRV